MRSFLVFSTLGLLPVSAADAPLRALLVCGGCCHDYEKQSVLLRDGIQARANVRVDVVLNPDKGTSPRFPIYAKADWAEKYDVVIHDECAANVKDLPYVNNVVNAHKQGKPAVNLHCAMHSYRTGDDTWFKFIGLKSTGHGPKKPLEVDFVDRDHPVTKGFENWTTGDEELYNNVKVFDTAKPLVLGHQDPGNGKKQTAVIAWTNDFHGTRVFNTSLGHTNETVGDARYLDFVTRGLLWSVDKLNDGHLKPYKGPAGTFERITAEKPRGQRNRGAANDLKNRGNITPKITKLTPEQEQEILKDVKVADGFDVSLFSTPSAANYPVYVAASPAGDLYVASDGNGSLGVAPERGRVLRLRDSDGDGRADEVTEFVKYLDSPRGMVWDHDRLYVIHPPDISCFIDADGDGVAEERKTLVDGIAFELKDRPGDHSTNGLSLGIDGWLYIAGGDFGLMEATGSDGKKLQHRAGGVIRFRPDGSGLEIFSTGTRNILGTPISPLLDLFARDNTNDGGGWEVFFHHFTGLGDHGYPRMFINFPQEIIQPLANYGGGSGCGSVYLSEPGFPEKWNNAPLTCDWGTNALWHHEVERAGATFKETRKPEPLVRLTRPTDADVDGMSHLYQASWKGATFNWEGPDAGYIVRISPKGYTPEPLPDFKKATEAELVRLLESPSQVRSMEAQRALLRRPETESMRKALVALAANKGKSLEARVAAVYALSQRGLKAEAAEPVVRTVAPLAKDPALERFVLRALADAGLDQFPAGKTTAPVELYAAGLASDDVKTQLEAIIGATRQNMQTLAPEIAKSLGADDPVLAHTAMRGLSVMGAADACFAIVDNQVAAEGQREGALRVLMRIHTPEVVQGLIDRLSRVVAPKDRFGLISALARLHFREGEWKGDSWGTRPDTRGPYYQPEPWSETPTIAAVLKTELANVSSADAAALIKELRRNRIEFNESLERLIALVKDDPAMLPALVEQLAAVETLPKDGVAYLIKAVNGDLPAETIALAVATLAKTDSKEGARESLSALARLDGKPAEAARKAFMAAPKLENHHQWLEDLAAKTDGTDSLWAEAALLSLSGRKDGSPESRERSKKSVAAGWDIPERRLQILQAIRLVKFRGLDDKVLAAVESADAKVAAAAKETAKALDLKKPAEDKTPLVGTMKPEDVVTAVVKMKGSASAGEQAFARCTACHAATAEEPQKGPYLGNIAQTYSRAELAANILDPGRTIAQGFATERFTLKDGTQRMGFVTLESAGQVKIRDIAAQEYTFKTSEIEKRDKLPNSLMPPGLVNDLTLKGFAGMLDYLEGLSKK